VWGRLSAIEGLPPPRALFAKKLIFLKSIGAVFTEAKKKKKKNALTLWSVRVHAWRDTLVPTGAA